MTKRQTTIIQVPFCGFYESIFDHEIDHQEEMFIDDRCDLDNAKWSEENEGNQPEHLRLTSGDYETLFSDHRDISAIHGAIALEYAGKLADHVDDCLGFKTGLKFSDTSSPKYYNFETDRLFCHIDLRAVRAMLAACKAESYATLKAVLIERHKSRDGFISHYSHNVAEWLEKPLIDWDHNELASLLIAALRMTGNDPDESEFRDAVDYSLLEGEAIYSAWSNGIDWRAMDEAIAEKRAEMQADWEADLRENDPELWALMEIRAQRCPLTIDMFL